MSIIDIARGCIDPSLLSIPNRMVSITNSRMYISTFVLGYVSWNRSSNSPGSTSLAASLFGESPGVPLLSVVEHHRSRSPDLCHDEVAMNATFSLACFTHVFNPTAKEAISRNFTLFFCLFATMFSVRLLSSIN